MRRISKKIAGSLFPGFIFWAILCSAFAQQPPELVYGLQNTEDHLRDNSSYQAKQIEITPHLLARPQYRKVHTALKNRTKKSSGAKIKAGDIKSFFVRNVLAMEAWFEIDAECIYSSDQLAIWINTQDRSLFSGSSQMGSIIEKLIHFIEVKTETASVDSTSGILDILHDYFGNAPDVDGDGVLDVLLLDIKDNFEETGSFVAGFFDPVNLFDHPSSNNRDMLYVDLYPSLLYEGEVNISRLASTIAHEYQHLIHANYEGTDLQYIFINEGLSELSEIICGFEPRKPDAYFQFPSRPLLSWNYANPLPDYARASLFMEYMFEQVGIENIKHLVETERTGLEALKEVLTNFSSLPFERLFMNWGNAMFLNDKSIDPSFGYQHPARKSMRFTSNHVYSQLPSGGRMTLPRLSHTPVLFPLTEFLEITATNNSIPVLLNGLATYPEGKKTYLGSSDLKAREKSFGSIETLVSNTTPQHSEQDTTASVYSFLATGFKSGAIVTKAYDDGIADAFSGNASFLLLNGTDDRYAVAFGAKDKTWFYNAAIKGIFLNELEGSNFTPEEPRDLVVQVFSFQNGTPAKALTPEITHIFSRPLGDLRFENIPLLDFYSDLSVLQDSFCVVIKNDADDANYFAVGMDHSGESFTQFTDAETGVWKPISERNAGASPLTGWNAMIRAETVTPEQDITHSISFPSIEYDYQGVRVSIVPTFKVDTSQSTMFAKLPSGRISQGRPIYKGQWNSQLSYEFPVEVDGTYNFYNRTISEDGQQVSREEWKWTLPDPGGLTLGTNYPNPFNLSTTIPFELLERGQVGAEVYDLLGRRVFTVPQRDYEAGPQTIPINFRGYASGMYLVRLNATRPNGRGASSKIRKIMLIK